MDTIFVVVHGYDFEGETILSICKSKTTSDNIINTYMSNDSLPHCGEWILNNDTWERGCEYLRIYKMLLED